MSEIIVPLSTHRYEVPFHPLWEPLSTPCGNLWLHIGVVIFEGTNKEMGGQITYLYQVTVSGFLMCCD